jgi:hypothetical protein
MMVGRPLGETSHVLPPSWRGGERKEVREEMGRKVGEGRKGTTWKVTKWKGMERKRTKKKDNDKEKGRRDPLCFAFILQG